MTIPSTYHHVQSSSRLIENEEEGEDEISLEETDNQTSTDLTNKAGFFQNNEDSSEEDKNSTFRQKIHRKLSFNKETKTTLKTSENVTELPEKNKIGPKVNHNRRRTNSFNDVKLPKLNHNRINDNHHRSSNTDVIDIKSSFKRIISAGKQILPTSEQLTKHLEHSTGKKPTNIHHSYSRSRSYNQNQTYLNTEDLFADQELYNSKNTKVNSLQVDNSNVVQANFTPPAMLVEEVSLISSSGSHSSTTSSSRSKTRLINEEEEETSLLENRHKLFVDENNNLLEKVGGCELVHLENLKLNRQKSDSIRMRHNSSNKALYVPNSNLKLHTFVNSDSSNNLLNGNNFMMVKDLDSPTGSSDDGQVEFSKRNRRHDGCFNNYFTITLLFVVNLLNYIDRYTLAGVLLETQEYFDINDSESGLLQTVFICSYMLLAPLFGYLGDRYPRKWLIVFGISFWSFMTLIGSFVPGDMFWLFMLIRSCVGIGEASYSCVAPTIIGDLFTAETRTRMLAIFYLAVPVGSGMGYIVGSNISQAFGDWRWALRFTPMMGFICVILLILFVKEPKRGGAEGSKQETNNSSIFEDAIYLCKNKTFMWITIGFTFASFVLGGLSWWVPTYVAFAIQSNNEEPQQIPLIFGVITCISGLFGVAASSYLAPKLREVTKKGDPIVCALGSLIAVPALFILILITRSANPIIFWSIAFLAISAMCLSWTIVADILLYVIHPTKRSIASAFNILICHLFGDAFSPYVIGAISDALRSGKPDTFYNRYTSLQTALYAGPVFAMLSFAGYLFAALYVEEDKKKVELIIKKSQKNLSDPILSPGTNDLTSTANPIYNSGVAPEQLVNSVNEHNSTEGFRQQKGLLKDSNEVLADSDVYAPNTSEENLNPIN